MSKARVPCPVPRVPDSDTLPRAQQFCHCPRLGKATLGHKGRVAVKDFAGRSQAVNLQMILKWRKESEGLLLSPVTRRKARI